ncbi:MAG: hypothetical protein GXN96_01750 [Aquificae bacterium]|nr:hypothetical protein [Aquificota bacterium]
MPANPMNAGKDKGNLPMEINNLLISARLRKMEYEAIVGELELDELKYDLFQYRELLEKEIMPYVERAKSSGNQELLGKAEEVKSIYEEIIDMITARIEELSRK